MWICVALHHEGRGRCSTCRRDRTGKRRALRDLTHERELNGIKINYRSALHGNERASMCIYLKTYMHDEACRTFLSRILVPSYLIEVQKYRDTDLGLLQIENIRHMIYTSPHGMIAKIFFKFSYCSPPSSNDAANCFANHCAFERFRSPS